MYVVRVIPGNYGKFESFMFYHDLQKLFKFKNMNIMQLTYFMKVNFS